MESSDNAPILRLFELVGRSLNAPSMEGSDQSIVQQHTNPISESLARCPGDQLLRSSIALASPLHEYGTHGLDCLSRFEAALATA